MAKAGNRWAALVLGVIAALVFGGCAQEEAQLEASAPVARAEPAPTPTTATTRRDTTEQDIASLRAEVPDLTYAEARYLVTVCFRLPDPQADRCIEEFVRSSAPPPPTTRYSPPPSYYTPSTARYSPPPTYYLPPTYSSPYPTTPYSGNGGGPTLCMDGSISNSSGRGTCSHHGGISR